MKTTFSFLCRNADLVRNTETFGKMDPYVKITCGKKSVKTKYIDEAGQKPVWDATVNLDIENPDPKAEVLIEVWDKDVTYDDMIGGTKITLNDFLQF